MRNKIGFSSIEESVYIDKKTKDRLLRMSGRNNRTIVDQIRAMLDEAEKK